MQDLKDMVKGKVKFQYFRDQALWYATECGFIFPVPLSDTGEATFNAEDKAILFMRWIKKYRDEVVAESKSPITLGKDMIGTETFDLLKDKLFNTGTTQEYLAGRNGYIPRGRGR